MCPVTAGAGNGDARTGLSGGESLSQRLTGIDGQCSMTTRRSLVLVLLLAALAGVGAWQRGWLELAPAPPPAAPRPSPPPRFEAAWATEQEWLVDRITRDVRELGALAAGSGLPPAAAPAVRPEAIRFEEHLFEPRAYEPLAREALGALTAAAAGGDSTEDGRLIAALVEPLTSVLLAEDRALSRRLEAEPRDPGAHERAALLLGAFALRDGDAGTGSSDVRPALTRVTAHLALAQALRGPAGPGAASRLAHAVLVTLVGRERDALARLDALGAGAASPAEKAWLRALRLRNTGDWRIARDENRLTLLETREEFRALVFGQDDESALAWLAPRKPAALSDWGRIALSASSPSVGTSNRFADFQIAADLAEATEVMTELRGAPVDEGRFFDSLNEGASGSVERGPEGRARIAVLGWSLWAGRFQRNLASALVYGYKNREMTGQPGERKAFAEQARTRFGRLATYALVLRAHAADAQGYRAAMAAVRELAIHSPERLTGADWLYMRAVETFAPVPRDLPDQNAWFRPALPFGTLLDADWRFELIAQLGAITEPELAALRGLAPHNLPLAIFAAGRLPVDRRSAADLTAVYGPLAELHVPTMSAIAHAAWYDPAQFRERQGALCAIEGGYCLRLGYRLAELGFPDEAAVAYQKGFDRARDRVEAANESRWLVDYYFDHGQLRRAEAVAAEAAAVYSRAGLFTMARLMERMGRLREAEDHYQRIRDRYRDAGELAGFYYRRARIEGKPEYETRLRDALALALPSGLEPLDRARLTAPPRDGVVIRGANDNTKRYGLQFDHVIVGLDGFRVSSVETYEAVRALSQASRMALVVWRGTRYEDVEVELWDRRFRVEIATFTPANP